MARADTNNDGELSEEELNALTKAELLDLANDLGVAGVSSRNTKAVIIDAILTARGGGSDG